MLPNDRRFPPALAAAMAVRLDCIGTDGVDFEPYKAFLTAEETTDWLRAWTGNGGVSGDAFLVFGQDGTGGNAAFWLIRTGRPVAEQPVVFLGSEGETGVAARNLGAFLWLLAEGYGPWEATAFDDPEPGWLPRPNRELAMIAREFATGAPVSAATVVEQARQEFPEFDDTVMALCR